LFYDQKTTADFAHFFNEFPYLGISTCLCRSSNGINCDRTSNGNDGHTNKIEHYHSRCLLPFSPNGIVWDFNEIRLVNQLAIPTSIELLKEPQLELETYRFACCSLMLISMGNQNVVIKLSNLLKRQDLSCEQRIYLAWCIGKIDKGNKLAISTLNEIFYEIKLVELKQFYEK
jgi:hypothetical protein